ncbi:B-block binding subunit of TFIIIC [Phytophthora infestans]|uniref:B-block binding subunit of TFIIIC n=1 Tax=Phytophthora infestans TaxID=4787 RepID=A0A833T2P5_PHYIN|nr:B-block binding subunit of TFIIIC [Phytophthora infestans]
MSSRSPRDLVAACMDHIALEGSSGLSVASLFSSVESSDDVFVRRQVWRRLRSSHGVLHFFRGSATSIQKLSKKRKRPGPTDNEDNLVEIKREMLQAAGVLAVDDTTALTTEEMALLTYEEAVAEQQEQDKQVMVAACEELRHRALNIPVKAIAADLGAEHLVILEAVGRARVQGVTVTTLTSLLSGGTVKRLHNCLDTLISNGLVVKRMMIVARPAMRRLNIIHLPRFAAEFRPQMFDESADFESDEQSRKILCAAAEKYLKGLPTHSSVLSDLGRDLSLQKRHLEVLRSHVMQECKADENFPLELFQAVLQPSRRASLEPKILNCVRYKPPNTRKNSAYHRGIVLELGLLHQIYGIIEDSADNGATIIDLRNQIVLPGSKLPYKLVGVLAGMYSLKAESIILGKNKAFRLYLDSMAPTASTDKDNKRTDNTRPQASQTTRITSGDDVTVTGVKVERQYTVRANKALKVALGGAEVDGTSARRREHILERLEDEKIISLSSLRDSVFSMEKQRADGETTTYTNVNCLMSPVAVGKVDTRSIFRIATELEGSRKLRLLQLPLPARNVSTKFRALRCVVAPGYEHNDVFIQGFVKNYCRDERLRRIHRNADQSEVVRFHKIEAENNEKVEHGSARKRPRTESKKGSANANETKNLISASDGVPVTNIETIRHASDIEAEVSVPALPQRNEISYKIRRFVSQQKSGIHNQQFRKLGFAYGVMYRCKILHRFLWNALHANGSNLQLPGDGNDVSIQSLNEDDRGERSASGSQATPLPGIVFSRESVLHSMPVYLYIQIFSGGGILTDAEFAVVEEAVAHQRTFDAMPETLREKIWCHESQRTSKVLGTLADLGLVQPHKIGMKHLVKILRAGYTDGRDGVLSRALKDNALGGLFRFNKQVRISLNDCGTNDDLQTGTERRGVNELDSIRIVGFTEKTYSFSNALPLQFSFESVCDVDRYWEALECLCLEQMAMEVETPRRNEPAVCEVPKPVKTRARRMLRILAWIPKSRKPVAKDKREDGADGLTAPQFKSSGIVSSNIRPRKRRRAQPGGDDIDGVKRKHRKKHPDNLDEDQSNVGALTWTDEHEQLLVEYFIDNCKSRWRITIPQGLQRENEQIAFRNHTISRTGFGLVAIARKLGKRKIDVKKRLKEKLMEPVVKLLFESAKREAELAENVGGLFDEEMAIQGSTRLTALFRRAVMMIVSPREDYHPLVAEELISFWTPHEIRLVWRYLWLKNWIVRASEKERGRGYSTSKRLQDSLKVNTLSYPLLLFQQAAEQESMVSSTLEEIAGDSNDVRQSDQLFEDDFPTNATPGQCALELGCQVLRTCSLAATHSSAFDTDKGIADALATQQTNGKRLPSSTKRESLLTCKSLKDRSGFAAHLANKVNVARASDLIDSWRVETKMHAVSVENADLLSICEAFSQVETGYKSALDEVASRPLRYRKESDEALGQAVIAHVRESGEEGLTLSFLTEKVCSKSDSEMRVGIARCLDALVDQGELICVNAYKDQRYIVKEHGDVWMLRPFSLVPSSTPLSTPHVVFEGEKDTLSFPWLKMDGGTNYKFLFSIQRKLLALILQAPGITEKRAHTNLNKLLSLQDTREAMSLLVDEGLVYARATTHPAAAQARNLFGSSLTQPSVPKVVKFAGRVLAYDRSVFEVHYFPHVQCIQRFGSIVQDYQNEVFQND